MSRVAIEDPEEETEITDEEMKAMVGGAYRKINWTRESHEIKGGVQSGRFEKASPKLSPKRGRSRGQKGAVIRKMG